MWRLNKRYDFFSPKSGNRTDMVVHRSVVGVGCEIGSVIRELLIFFLVKNQCCSSGYVS